jgi:putative endonuclease
LGEIDLIMQDDNVLLFIEVRARNNLKYVDSAASISYQKQQKIIQAAQTFLMQNAKYIDYYCRFDVIAIDNGDIKWIQNAFEVE